MDIVSSTYFEIETRMGSMSNSQPRFCLRSYNSTGYVNNLILQYWWRSNALLFLHSAAGIGIKTGAHLNYVGVDVFTELKSPTLPKILFFSHPIAPLIIAYSGQAQPIGC